MKINKILGLLILLPLISAVKPQSFGYTPGSMVADFNLTNVDGKKAGFSNFPDAKGYIVIFTCNHCPFSKAYEDRIVALDAKYKTLGYPVIAINPNDAEQYPDDSYENMKLRATEKGFTFPYLLDETQEVAKLWGAEKTPHVFVVQRESIGNIVKYVGAIDNNSKDAALADKKYVENAVDELLAYKPVTVSSTKAVGCGVKWKP